MCAPTTTVRPKGVFTPLLAKLAKTEAMPPGVNFSMVALLAFATNRLPALSNAMAEGRT